MGQGIRKKGSTTVDINDGAVCDTKKITFLRMKENYDLNKKITRQSERFAQKVEVNIYLC